VPTDVRTLFLLALLLVDLAMPSVEALVLVDAPEGAAVGQGTSGAGGVLGHNMLCRSGLETRVVGYKGQHQASEARRSAKQPFAPTIGFAGLAAFASNSGLRK
jgi:hypothetical protein